MAIKWMDGFDHFANINGATAATATLTSAGYTTTSSGADSVLLVAGRLPDSYCVRLRQDSTAGQAGSLSRSFESTEDYVSIGFAYMATERSPIVQIEGLIDLLWPVGCQLNGVNGTAIPIRNIWYYFELVIDKVNDTISLYINNTLDITAPLPVEGQNMTNYTIKWGAGVTGSNVTTQLIDDIMLLDSSGTGVASRLGPIEITTRFPSSNVQAEWEPSIEGAPLYSMVNKRPPEAGSYILSNVSGREATFLSDKLLPTDSPVFAIGVVARVLKTDIDNRQLGLVWGDGVNRLEKIETELSTEFQYKYAFFEEPAPGQIWTKEIVEANSFGVKVRP